jgi:DNA polymerase-3 subunit alpha (Gram-positive type)
MYARGFTFRNIDLKRSESTRFVIEDNSLIPPFSSLDGLGHIAAESIVKARESSPFISKEDLSNRTQITRNTLEVFNALGITMELEEDNQLSLF